MAWIILVSVNKWTSDKFLLTLSLDHDFHSKFSVHILQTFKIIWNSCIVCHLTVCQWIQNIWNIFCYKYLSKWLGHLPLHLTPASSAWPQLWFLCPLCGHSKMLRSLPLHRTLSSAMSTEPCPNKAPVVASLASPNPILLQTTWASFRSQSWSHTVPQDPLVNTSNLPAHAKLPELPIMRISI